jgi:transcription initiation factor TFIID subunit 4
VRAQKAQPTASLPNSVQVTQKSQASSGAQLKQVITNNNNVNINNNNNAKNNNNKSQVSIAVVSSVNNSTANHSKSSTTSPHSKSLSTKSNAISNSHPATSPTKSPTFNNKTHHETTPKKSQGSAAKAKDKKTSLASIAAASASSGGNNAMSNFYPTFGDDDINDVAAMGGVNLAEESQKILGSTEFVGTQIRSCKDEVLLNLSVLQQRIRQQMARHGLEEPSLDVAVLISHATQEHLKNITEKLSVIAEHRMDILKVRDEF